LSRTGAAKRRTGETDISVELTLDGQGRAEINTGLPFFDHMLTLTAVHGLLDLTVKAVGDTTVDGHHTVEDVGLVLGQALDEALGDRQGIVRYGSALVPMDESLVRGVIDLSGRPYLVYDVAPPTERVGDFDTQLPREFFGAVVGRGRLTLHLTGLSGVNSHHLIEAVFKAFGRALREACRLDPARAGVPSSKGVL
jgi:imidazoleglycerol-phosphate dehydratase